MKILISEENFIHNINFLKKKYNKNILPVIKANAYGHGSEIIVKILIKYGINQCVVARISEAMELLNNIDIPKEFKIIILETIEKEDLKEVLKYPQLIVTANSEKDLLNFLGYGISSKKIQLKIDLGFGRNGIVLDDIYKIKKIILENNLKFSGIFSHLFSVDYLTGIKLIEKFNEALVELGRENFQMVHLQNSLAISNYGSLPFVTHLRPGMFIYGFFEDGAYEENLKKVISLNGEIITIKNIENLEYLAYLKKGELKNKFLKNIAFIKIGYGDGFLKNNEGDFILINNKPYKIVLITMDNTFIDVDDEVKVGDKVEIYSDLYSSKKWLNMNICEYLPILSKRIIREIK